MRHAPYQGSPAFGRRWLAAAALSVFLVAGMFYVGPSGMPQPADFLFMVVAAFLFWPAMGLKIAHGDHAAAALVVWVVVVNGTWYIVSGESEFIKFASFYAFNFLVFISFAYVYEQHGPLAARWFRLSIIAALLMQFSILAGGGDTFRALGSFNNPNQLGYWSLLLLATYGVIIHDRKLSLIDLGVVALALWICMQSLSRAAIAPAVVIFLIFLLLHPARKYVRAILACGIVSVLFILSFQGGITNYISKVQTFDGIERRYSKTDKRQRSELEVRGYDRIWRFPEYNLVGAGEGAEWRFYEDGGFEVHSSFGVMLFCYGIVGLLLFLFVMYQSLRSTPFLVMAYFAPVLTYGLTHQGLRFSYFWILLGIIAAIGSRYRAERRNPRSGLMKLALTRARLGR